MLVSAVLVAGCASTNGLSTEASLRDPNDLQLSIGLIRALGGGFTAPDDPIANAR